jgi:S-sulfo-L-cysteine synthase (3-phospho-L-serine-dependent)
MTRVVMIETNMSGSGFQALRMARRLGIDVTFLARDRSLYESVPGVAEILAETVDELVECDTNDVDSLVGAVRTRQGRGPVDGVFAFGEYHIAVAAQVANRLGYPGPAPEAVRIARNKDEMRRRCQQAGLAVPRFAVVTDEDGARSALDRVGLPAVVKPADESGSIDVMRCLDAADVVAAFRAIRATPVNYRGQRRSPLVLVEEYVGGPELSVETLSWDGRASVLGVTDKQLGGGCRFVEMGHAFPSGLDQSTVDTCARLATDALTAIGLDLGPAHVEIKIGPDGPRLIEINARAGGDRIPDLIELTTGLSVLRQTLDLYLGRRPPPPAAPVGGAAIRFARAEPGVVRRIAGVELARRVPGVVDVGLEVGVGRTVRPLGDAHDRVAYALARGDTTYQACRSAEVALDQLQVDTVPVPAGT